MNDHFVRPDVQALLDMLNAQPGPKMPARLGHRADGFCSQFCRQLVQLPVRQRLQVRGEAHLV